MRIHRTAAAAFPLPLPGIPGGPPGFKYGFPADPLFCYLYVASILRRSPPWASSAGLVQHPARRARRTDGRPVLFQLPPNRLQPPGGGGIQPIFPEPSRQHCPSGHHRRGWQPAIAHVAVDGSRRADHRLHPDTPGQELRQEGRVCRFYPRPPEKHPRSGGSVAGTARAGWPQLKRAAPAAVNRIHLIWGRQRQLLPGPDGRG